MMAPIVPGTLSPVATALDGPRFLIADVAALTGVAPSQLRSWEQAGLLCPLRSSGAVRLYAREDVARVRLIKRSLVNPGRRGSVRRVMARLASGELHPEPYDYAGLGEVDTPHADGLSARDRPTPTGTDASAPVAAPGRARGATRGGTETVEDGAQWRAVLDAMADLVAVCDARGRLTYTNPALQAVLPPAPGADGRVCSGAAPLPTPLDALSLRWAALTGTQHRDVIVQLHGPDGVERRTVWTVTPVRAGDGAERGAVAVGRDVTVEQAQAQAQEDALAMTAHDLRGPLTTVLGNLQLARQIITPHTPPGVGGHPGPAAPPVARLIRHLEVAETGARELIRTMETMLDASAATAGALVQQLEPDGVDLGAVARQAVDHARTLSRRHVITLVGPPRPPLVVGDRVRLRQVLDNLLANAVKYAPDGGPIVVRLTVVATLPAGDGGGITGGAAAPAPQGMSDPPSWVLLRVADTGLGIPPADVPHVFERYWRAGGATRVIRGTGLGLYTCRAIVAAHGGHVWVERTAVAAELHTGPAQSQPGRAAPPTGLSEQSAGWHGTVMALALPLALPGAEGGGEEQARAPGKVDG